MEQLDAGELHAGLAHGRGTTGAALDRWYRDGVTEATDYLHTGPAVVDIDRTIRCCRHYAGDRFRSDFRRAYWLGAARTLRAAVRVVA